MPTCRDLAAQVGGCDSERPGLLRRWALRLHYRICPPCRRYRDQIRDLGEIARRECPEHCPDRTAALEARICDELGLPRPRD